MSCLVIEFISLDSVCNISKLVLDNALSNENEMNCDIIYVLQLKRTFGKKKLPPAPQKGILRMKSRELLEEVCNSFILTIAARIPSDEFILYLGVLHHNLYFIVKNVNLLQSMNSKVKW